MAPASGDRGGRFTFRYSGGVRLAVVMVVLALARPVLACGGTGLSLVEVWPPPGDVPANVQTVVTYCGPTAFAEDVRALEAVSFRVAGESAARATTVRELLGKPTVLDHRIAARATAELPVGADVEVLARVSKADC